MSTLEGLLRTHHNGELTSTHIGETVSLCGWVNTYRDLGGLHFIDLRDKYGITQLGFEEFTGDLNILKKCYAETVIKATGVVRARPESAKNNKMKTGEIEVSVTALEIMSEVNPDKLPFLPHGKIEAKEETRLRYRYLDLRTNKLQSILKLRSDTAQNARSFLTSQDFIEVETPILYKSTPEGARDYIVPSRVHAGSVYALPQSPQTLKQLLMIGSTDKYFQIVKCFRDEDLRADRQPEFTQIDIEVSFATQAYMKGLATGIVRKLFSDATIQLKDMSYEDAIAVYGTDKPDTRFGLEHHIVTSIFTGSEFKVFSELEEKGGIVKAMFLPSSVTTPSRKVLDGYTKIVEPYGGKGVAFFKTENGERSGGISKFISDDMYTKLSGQLSSEENLDGVWLFIGNENPEIVHACADALRRHLGNEHSLADPNQYDFLWVHSFPLLEYDEGFGRYIACHHPFTMPSSTRLSEFLEGDLAKQDLFANFPSEAYDVVCNGYEIGGGSVRIHDQNIQRKMFELLGMDEEEVEKQFGFFVEALSHGVPPHAGIAFGLDRIVMLLAKTDSIRDVIAFPKTTSASCLMSSSPSKPSEDQVNELHFKWNTK